MVSIVEMEKPTKMSSLVEEKEEKEQPPPAVAEIVTLGSRGMTPSENGDINLSFRTAAAAHPCPHEEKGKEEEEKEEEEKEEEGEEEEDIDAQNTREAEAENTV